MSLVSVESWLDIFTVASGIEYYRMVKLSLHVSSQLTTLTRMHFLVCARLRMCRLAAARTRPTPRETGECVDRW